MEQQQAQSTLPTPPYQTLNNEILKARDHQATLREDVASKIFIGLVLKQVELKGQAISEADIGTASILAIESTNHFLRRISK